MNEQQYDERLWFNHRGCLGRHFLLGNPHTFPGRMMGWCERKQRSFFFSKTEVEECSPEAAAWIEGFLAGNEPSPPRDSEGNVQFGSDRYQAWVIQMQSFRELGHLPPESESDA
jgi:hypothetical protein